ncbi:hypothetical protein MRI28_03175 [Nocardiopsis dassonvillei]|uniref:hypothetical protein n=1 Tax=Nocardiopsis dassonvillei TaxID=2014 RepID=UPI00200EC7B6|nr:hypothetical protein [Nocardiopsis dassonvillei]MCK9868662.1 hypothetical protein [Nocardiopsis dassonvillei]
MSAELYRGLFDDAALFPPGNAPMGGALPAHRAHRAGQRAEYVGPFLVSDARVGELRAVLAARLDEHLPEGAEGFVEVSRQGDVPAELRSLAGTGHSAKFRTGGLTVEAHPAEEELAEFLHAAVELGVPFKCTAGLHHAVRHTTAEGFEQHGFLNVLLATAALLDGASEREAALVLADRDGPRLAALAAKLTDDEARRVRDRFRSFGTCSVTEPLEDLVVLGALPASRAR